MHWIHSPVYRPSPPGPAANLLQAAFDGDIPLLKSQVKKLDKGRGRPNKVIEAMRVEDAGELEGLGALQIAACRGRLEVCRYLVGELRVDVDGVDKKGRTPLFFAICSTDVAHVAIAKYLLDHGANLDKAGHDDFSPLHYAAGSGDCEMVELLLAKGAYVDPVGPFGTPLHTAASQRHDAVMKILLGNNADYNKMVNGRTPLIAAMDTESRECILLLLKKEPMFKKEIKAAALKKLGSCYFKKKDYRLAVKGYSKATQLNLGDATLFSNRSLCWLLMGDGGKALVDANQCRAMRPDWPKACYRQGVALMLLKDYKGASERFSEGLKLDPGNAEIEHALRIDDEMCKICEVQGLV
ncbi:hypothetical protein VPH35_015775 [Triticum aestivum]